MSAVMQNGIRQKIEAVERRTPSAPELRYSTGLLELLKQEHADLARRYADLESMAITGRYEPVVPALGAWLAEFYRHATTQSARLYPFLEQRFAGAPIVQHVLQRLRDDMDAFEQELYGFVRRYLKAGVRFTNAQVFLQELRRMGALQVLRIERERTELYPLYTA